jgi:hypothetical protein
MIPKQSEDSTGIIRARLAYLRKRKAALDVLIRSLELYAHYADPIQAVPQCRPGGGASAPAGAVRSRLRPG